MSQEEEFDRIIRQAMPPVTITDDRVDRLVDTVLLQAKPHPRPVRALVKERRERGWPVFASVLRFAVPMVLAVILGISVGQTYEDDLAVAQFSSLYLSTSLVPTGS